MKEPFLMAVPLMVSPKIWTGKIRVKSKTEKTGICLVPTTADILSGLRKPYTHEELKEYKDIMTAAVANTNKVEVLMGHDNEYLSIKAKNENAGIPVAAVFFCNKEHVLFSKLNINPEDYYMIFMTGNEVLLADKKDIQPSAIRKTITNIRHRLMDVESKYSLILSTGIYVYNPADRWYYEI